MLVQYLETKVSYTSVTLVLEITKQFMEAEHYMLQKALFLYVNTCTLSNNQVNMEDIEDGYGGAIFLSNSTANVINVNFTGNKANSGGGLFFVLHSKVRMQQTRFSQNSAVLGSAVYGSFSCKLSCEECSLYVNENVAENNDTKGAAFNIHNHSKINVTDFKCEFHVGYFWSCIVATNNSSVYIHNAMFNSNTGSTILLVNNSHLLTLNSSFLNNTTPGFGAAIHLETSTLNLSHSFFYNNKAKKKGISFLNHSRAALNNCTFSNNSESAVALFFNTTVSIVNCTYENNSSPDLGGALCIKNVVDVIVSHTTFQGNSAGFGGAVFAISPSSLVIWNCSFSANVAIDSKKYIVKKAIGGGGAIFIMDSVLKIFQSQFKSNFAIEGGSLISANSSLLIRNSVFENNRATLYGGAMALTNYSSLIIEDSSLINNSILDRGIGGCLFVTLNSTAKISSVLMSENKGQTGAALSSVADSQVTLFDCSIVRNKGWVVIVTSNNASLQIDSCVFFNNSGQTVHVSHSSRSIVNVTNSRFTLHTESNFYIEFSAVSFHNCSFSNNSASFGAALMTDSSNIHLIGCNFTGNTAKEDGGVFLISGSLFISHCIMTDNTAQRDGGVGVLGVNSQVNISTTVFSGNSALRSGGVLSILSGHVRVWNSSFMKNTAGVGGGVIFTLYHSLLDISQTTHYTNKADIGGVLFGKASKVSVKDSLIHGNSATMCGVLAIYEKSVLEISFSQVSKNKANFSAGAFYIYNSSLLISKS